MDQSRDASARRLAESHFELEPGIRLIRRLVSRGHENEASEPVKLLEVNEFTTADGIRPVYFGSHPQTGLYFPCAIIEVTPQEYRKIVDDPSQLPHDWVLGVEYARPSHAVAG